MDFMMNFVNWFMPLIIAANGIILILGSTLNWEKLGAKFRGEPEICYSDDYMKIKNEWK